MDIQKEKFIKRFKSTFVYDLLSETLTDEQLFEHVIDTNGDIIWFKDQTRQMWFMWQAAQKVAVPEGFVLVPKLSANYLFNTIPTLNFKHQDEKDTVLYHLNYMTSEFKDLAKQFVLNDHAEQKTMIEVGAIK